MRHVKDLLREPKRGAPGPPRPDQAREPECAECGGARFVRVTTDIEHPDFGRATPCRCARAEDEAERRTRLLRYSRLGALERFTFETLLPHGRSGATRSRERYSAAVEAARHFAERPEGWLVLSGVPGCGKTHLAAAIVNRSIERGSPALFFTVADLLDRLRASYDDEAEFGYDRLSEHVRDAPLLVLDDLDGYSETAWAREKFVQVVSHRFNATLPTVFASVTAPDEIDGRLGARLSDPSLVQQFVLEEPARQQFISIGGMTRRELERFTFETFNENGKNLVRKDRENLAGAILSTRRWAGTPEGWIVLYGESGTGKTHLAAAIANYRLESGDRVAFATVPDLLDELRATFDPDSGERFDTLFRRLRDVDLLILDDLGAHQSSGWAQEKLYQLLNYRHLGRRPTVVTSDLELTKLEPRIASRLGDLQVATVYELRVPDYRMGS